MSQCPEIEALIERQPAALQHAAACSACAAVQALGELRGERTAGREDACVDAEVALALRAEGLLDQEQEQALSAHLESCAECNEVAVRVLSSQGAMPGDVAVAQENRAAERRARAPWGLALGFAASIAAAALLGALWMRDKARVVVPETPRSVETTAPAFGRPASAPEPPSAAPELAPAPPLAPPVPSVPKPPKKAEPALIDPWAPSTSAPPAPAAPGVGYLTILCVPTCDSVVAGGKNLGASPVVRAPLASGPVNVELVRGKIRRFVRVQIVADKTTARRISMDEPSTVVDPWR